MTKKELQIKSSQYRKQLLTHIKGAKAGHTGGSLSCIDILNVLYNEIMNVSPENFHAPDRDRYIQSKGHSVEALYTVLADQGFFPESKLKTMGQYKSHFIGHPTKKVHGVEQNTGALGHGLAIGAGIAIAGKKDALDYKVYVLMGDGELAEGSNWEAAMIASHYNLDNLIAIVDRNTLQITDNTKNVCNSEPLAQKFEAFGWAVKEVDGHDVMDLKNTFLSAPFTKGKPNLIIANTTKGKGISYMEGILKWHHGVPSDDEFEMAINELENLEKELIQS